MEFYLRFRCSDDTDAFEVLGWEMYYLLRDVLFLSTHPKSFDLKAVRHHVYGEVSEDHNGAIVHRCMGRRYAECWQTTSRHYHGRQLPAHCSIHTGIKSASSHANPGFTTSLSPAITCVIVWGRFRANAEAHWQASELHQCTL
ncbi:hypothetical protein ABB37_07691 [Leptomonas pyrrhocoris]|uniref:Uncharacterized protein n=1 Tax=Leptomonas pyrrhocoris TaxID=157538 RepID=A0A0N0DSQ2_LEPPY|nr:hypothetical protein ABB37_08885 [Leptomonas pyrrhocoris]XP_015654780.1 hypothetical protein ABB37_07691 [Leptomonas pyrrhocoris]KPA74879.1 hypothetical protein ABB37_08885 [Leptomonas pyrrhocoris]KPA76341.1 hypothetical protein ABB37_07691 [Leptomonas pyrrhocoris]|eukprot:XP_015653318.1 hypothetical protein ABB37_08885 [Leptomonas pyrrhocoris]